MRLFYLFPLSLLLAPAFAGAQAISINTDGSNPDLMARVPEYIILKNFLFINKTT